MPRLPDFSHAALAETLHETVASKLARFGDRFAQRVDDAGAHVGHDRDEKVRQDDPEEELRGVRTVRRSPCCHHEPDNNGSRRQRSEGEQSHFAGTRGDGHGKKKGPRRDPGQTDPATHVEPHRLQVLRKGDAVAADDLEDQADVHDQRRRHTFAHGERPHEERHGNGDHARDPVCGVVEKPCAIAGEKKVGEEAGHEEGEGVEKRQDAKPRDRLAEKLGRQRPGAGARHRGTQSGTWHQNRATRRS